MNGRKNACKSKNLFVIYIILSTMENVNVEVVFTLTNTAFFMPSYRQKERNSALTKGWS